MLLLHRTSPVAVGVGGGNEEMQAEIDYLLNENEQLRERQRQQEVEMSREISEIQERFIQLKSVSTSVSFSTALLSYGFCRKDELFFTLLCS